ncbi:MAG TPA: heparin lyase I family protein, partial [Acidimicrobiales bacterium]|nr:heparin lyase I family protein [Acidimicrobiales bacterium]
MSGAITQSSLRGTPWQNAQCAPTTPSKSPRYRGTATYDPTNQPLTGQSSYLFSLPTDPSPSTYPLEACDVISASKPLAIGADGYYGMMVYVPKGWSIPNRAFNGIEIAELHFQNVDGAPISLQLHPDHVTLALETGACSNHATTSPGCVIRSNADANCKSTTTYTCLPGQYAIPIGAFVQGAWNEIILHANWETSYTGQIQTWYKVKGASSWTQSSNLSNIPTIQYDATRGSAYTGYNDILEAYTAALSAPVTVSLGGYTSGTSFATVAGQM